MVDFPKQHILPSWWPTRELPEDTFQEPLSKFSQAIAGMSEHGAEFEKFVKDLVKTAIGFMVSIVEPSSLYSCSTEPTERPPLFYCIAPHGY